MCGNILYIFPSVVTEGVVCSGHLLPGPQLLRFEDGGGQQPDPARLVGQPSVHQLGVLVLGDEAASDGHLGS